MRTINLLSGIPASGKTTHVKANAQLTDIILSRDEWREKRGGYQAGEDKAWTAHIMATLAKNKAADIWIDQTTIGIGALEKWLKNIAITQSDRIIVHVLSMPLETCLERNSKRTGNALVPESQLRHMYENHMSTPITADAIAKLMLPYEVCLRVYK